MIDKKEMLMKVASYDKAACVLANTVMAYSELKKKAAYDNLPVAPSNAFQGALADQLVEGPRTLATIGGGAGLGLLAGLLLGHAAEPKNSWQPRGASTAVGGWLGATAGLNGAMLFEAIRRTIKAKNDVQKYRAAEAKQTGIEDKEDIDKETKTASVKSIVDGVLNKKAVDKKNVVITLLNKAISK